MEEIRCDMDAPRADAEHSRAQACSAAGLGGRAEVIDRVLCCPLSIASSASLPRPRRLHGAVLDCQGALSVEAGTVVLRSRRGTDMGPAFPEIVAAAGGLPDATAIDCVM